MPVEAGIEQERPRIQRSFGRSYDWDNPPTVVMVLDRFRDFLEDRGLLPAWVIRVYREATPALFMTGHSFDPRPGLKHHYRDVVWLVVGGPNAADFEVIKVTDQIEPFVRRTGASDTESTT